MKIFSKLYIFYQGRILPKIRNIRGANFVKRNILNPLVNFEHESPTEEPTHVFDREWDNLIILDACRHDIYQQLRGRDVDHIISVGSHSREFVKNTFTEDRKEFSDLIYITANGHISSPRFENFTGKKLRDTFDQVYDPFANDWDDEVSGIPPEAVARDARTAENLFPDQQKIIHFMQPHYPFIGSDKDVDYDYPEVLDEDKEKVIKAYTECLEQTFEIVDDLIEDLSGKTVITADHGEFLGENNLYGHLYGVKTEELRKVPWDVVNER